jgi:hypothetical protein
MYIIVFVNERILGENDAELYCKILYGIIKLI